MIYNEYAQVLEADRTRRPASSTSPTTSTSSTGTTTASRCSRTRSSSARRGSTTGNNRDVAVRFVRASLKGWIYCRDNPDDCVQYTTDAGSQLGAGHQKWMMNEVNALVWPSPLGVGDDRPGVLAARPSSVSKNAGHHQDRPVASTPTRRDIVKEALAGITDDTKGESFKKGTVEVTAGGN